VGAHLTEWRFAIGTFEQRCARDVRLAALLGADEATHLQSAVMERSCSLSNSSNQRGVLMKSPRTMGLTAPVLAGQHGAGCPFHTEDKEVAR
jgi:hypothetical protein